MMKEAAYYAKLENNTVRCELCPHRCRIRDGRHGICLTRENSGGRLWAANYCRPVSCAIDPIEKKPLFHFYPGSSIFSTGPNGCTFKCSFCQNHEISQETFDVREMPLRDFVHAIADSGTLGIAYTYSEPIIWYETIMAAGPLLRERGLKNVMVTNGYIEERPLSDLLSVVDAMNIDIKSMNPSFYRRLCKGSLESVLQTCESAKKSGCHVEITFLLIPGENDGPSETADLSAFMATHLGRETPLHISRYFPRYRMNRESTPEPLLERAWSIAREKLDFVYLGNVAAEGKENTCCPRCNAMLISRRGYRIEKSPLLIHSATTASTSALCGRCRSSVAIIM